jgi:competence protein ComEC
MKLIYLSLSLIAGVYLGSKAGLPWGVILLAGAGVLLLVLLWHRRRALLLFGLCLIILAGGIAHYQAVSSSIEEQSQQVQIYISEGCVEGIEGLVATDPEPGDKSTTLRLEQIRMKVDGEWREAPGGALVYAPRIPGFAAGRDFPYYRYGDVLRVEGDLELEGAREYLIRQGIYFTTYVYNPELIATGQGSKPLEWIYTLRDKMSQSLDMSLHEPQNSLAQAMLLGKRGTIPADVKEDFNETGTAHILAVSGLHVAIVAGITLSAAVWLFGRKRPTYFIIALAVIWIFAILTGWRPPVFRAAIMGSLWLSADYLGRPRSALPALLLAAAIMVGIHPMLLWDASFQLSFAAMAGLIFLTPKFQDLGAKAFKLSERSDFRASSSRFVIDSASVTLGAILFTLPLIAYYFHRISLVGLPATFFVLPALPGTIVTAALVGVVGLFALPLAHVLGYVTWLFATYAIKVVHLFSLLPFAAVDVGFSAAAVWAYFLAFAAILWLLSNRMRLRRLFHR